MVGAGPAGLTAAVYLARFKRRVLVVHDEESRARRIPRTHNAPGFPEGVTGPELVDRMEAQARLYGAQIDVGRIAMLERNAGGFEAMIDGHTSVQARAVILATGVRLNQVDLPPDVHEAALAMHCLRYCPICDGYEARGRSVAVLGGNPHGAREALFLRRFSEEVALLAVDSCDLTAVEREHLMDKGVEVIDDPVAALTPSKTGMDVRFDTLPARRFDVLYPALGSTPRSDLAASIGISTSPAGCLAADAHQRIGPGLWAAGDVVEGLDQISVAIGQGAIAATDAHNHLCEDEAMVL